MCVTEFAKPPVPNCTRTEIQLLNIKNLHSCSYYKPRNTKDVAIDGQACFHGRLFADPVKLLRYSYYRVCGASEWQ